MNLEAIATIMGIVGTIFGTFIAVSQFYRNRIKEIVDRNATAVTKAYAAERDFNHLKNDYQQLKIGLDQLTREIELRVDRLEFKFVRVETLIRILTKEVTGDPLSIIVSDDE